MARWTEFSPQKRSLISERYRNLWGSLDEVTKTQMKPVSAESSSSPTERKTKGSNITAPSLDLDHVDLLTGPEFEKFLGKAFEQKGYTVEYHGGPTEAGGDLVCWESSTERIHAILVQVKRERSLTGTQAIGQILRKENWFRQNYPNGTYEKWVITSSRFSSQARKEAENSKIVLLDREGLERWLDEGISQDGS